MMLGLESPRLIRIVAAIALAGAAASCSAAPQRSLVADGDAARGKEAMEAIGCGACHTIPGIASAHGEVGPPLAGMARRAFIGGEIANTTENMILWIENPQAIEPNTAMPNLGIGQNSARDIAAYLGTLR